LIDPIIMFLLAGGIIALAIMLVVEAVTLYRYHAKLEEFNELSESVIEGFDTVKSIINVNASSLRSTVIRLDELTKIVSVLNTLVDVHSVSIGVNNSNLRNQLENSTLLDLPIENLFVEEE
jgi:hypothetical protein